MKVWITKYALTKGIIVAEATIKDYRHDKYAHVKTAATDYFVAPNDWFDNQSEAIDRFLKIKNRKISNLHKQISELEKLEPTFEILSENSPEGDE